MYEPIARCSVLLVALCAADSAFADDFKLNRYVSSTVYNTNSYWLESDKGVVLIDAQMLRSDAELLATLIASSGKPVKGAIITHAHFDHYGGLNLLREKLGDFPVYTTQKTADGFKPNHTNALTWTPDVHGDNFDAVLVEADQIVESGETIEIAGIALKIDDIGAGEAENHIVIYQPDENILFTGDATFHQGHFYLGEGRSEGVLNQHEYLKANYGDAKMYYAGHGDPSVPAAVLDFQIEYVNYMRTIVEERVAEGNFMNDEKTGIQEGVKESLVNKMITRYPNLNDYGIGAEKLVGWGIAGVFGELGN